MGEGAVFMRVHVWGLEASLSTSFLIRPLLWESPWFWPAFAASSAAVNSHFIYTNSRRRKGRRLRDLRMEKMLDDDRARIARDMHDGLGMQITLLTMNSALIGRDMESDPDRARQHVMRLNALSRILVTRMNEEIRAIDPTSGTLNQLGIIIARHMFQ